ncbi:hypothetical protein [Nodosilinea nodulosa]|uniref:hypothetical protein n=1 Tax=Nodosilinea nodulosa TaxID=416001 RepID=UPI000315E681|nr:hypothetical protein [Nodosilinea nodulosa]
MAYLKRVSLALGLLAAAGAASPALAQNLDELDLSQAPLAEVEVAPAAAVESPVSNPVSSQAVGTEAAIETTEMSAGAANLLALPEAAPVASSDMFNNADINSALLAATVETSPEATDSLELAQSTRSAYEITPAYLGVGGNIGIGNRGQSGISSFGFNVISKISLGPRFSLRPGVTITNDRSSFTVPLTYNFNTLSFQGFRAQPYVGAGVDIPTSGNVGLLIDAGADVPISRDFTLNGAANFRVTDGFALGISVGVGYNFPFIFE